MSQRDKAETKVYNKHGSAGGFASGGWGPGGHSDGVNTEHRKAHNAAAKEAKRARRRLDKAIVEDEFERSPEDVFYAEPGKGDWWLEQARKLHAEEKWPRALHAWAMVQQYFDGDVQKEAREHGNVAAHYVAQSVQDDGGPFR